MRQENATELVARADAVDAATRQQFGAALLAGLAESELFGLDSAARARLVALVLGACAQRPAGHGSVHVETAEISIGQRRTYVILNQADMPFLVDGAKSAVAAERLPLHRLLHPVLQVARDAAGNLQALGAGVAESIVVIETDQTAPPQQAALRARLDAVGADAGRIAADRAAMADVLADAIARLQAQGAAGAADPDADAAEAAAFLRWLEAGNFTLMGAQAGDRALGILAAAPLSAAAPARGPIAFDTSASAARLYLHRPLRVVAVGGAPAASFVGLFTLAGLRQSPRTVPLLRGKVEAIVRHFGFAADSHNARLLDSLIETFPRAELFDADAAGLVALAQALLPVHDRPRTRLFLRGSADAGRVSALVCVRPELYSAALAADIGARLCAETGGRIGWAEAELNAVGPAYLRYSLEGVAPPLDAAALDAGVQSLTHDWTRDVEAALVEAAGPARAAELIAVYGRAFPAGYRAGTAAADAAADILRMAELAHSDRRQVVVFRRPGDGPTTVRLKVLCGNGTIALSRSVPILENFRFHVIEEDAYALAGGRLGWIHDLLLETDAPLDAFADFAATVAPAILAVLNDAQENDVFNQLTATLRLAAEESNWFRAWFRYLRQAGVSYSMQTVVDVLRRNGAATRALLEHFRARLDPSSAAGAEDAARAALAAAMAEVSGIADDQILRLLAALVAAMLRTNAFQSGAIPALAFKFRSADVPGLPSPRPWCEVWVYSARVEAIHLRGGPVARGGIRWSDRRDDFRTEVLGLLKAQMVKNAVIVPTGAKGGFYAKWLPDPALDRDGWLREGREAYRIFIRALLSITDNLDAAGQVVPAPQVARLDGDDAYLVVAADKGTAAFSDTANEIAQGAGFWLDDAFASGGSAGYDHKGMGITARGAWVSVTRHFAEMGIDVQSEPVTVAGVGDMSGDVFGNGMLRSRAVKLVAAFDHRHIFLDPDPDTTDGWAERNRLYHLPRSSWDDYDRALLSAGGGIYPRSLKSVPLTPEVQALLGVEADRLAPTELIAAILRAPVDLLWFGGIGTYLKGAQESNAEVGDHANDACRIDGREVRAKVVGEGANLGVTQAARIEYARGGGRINTDFIDNSAGVDTSDLEVNIKIGLAAVERAGRLGRAARNQLLKEMTDDVAELVLADNRAQTRALSVAEANAPARLHLHVRLMEALAQAGRLDIAVEGLPDSRAIAERQRLRQGLVRPELAVLLSHAKTELEDVLAESGVVDDPLTAADLLSHFPPALRARFADDLARHPLHREIIAMVLANEMVNRFGLTIAHDVAAETGCTLADAVAGFVAARALFDLDGLWQAVDAEPVAPQPALQLHAEAAAIAQALIADLVRQPDIGQPGVLVQRLQPGMARLLADPDRLAAHAAQPEAVAHRQRLAALGVSEALAGRLQLLAAMAGAAGVVALAAELHIDEVAAAQAYDELGRRLGLDWARGAARTLVPADDWERLLATEAARRFETVRLDLLRRIARNGDPAAGVASWFAGNGAARALAQTIESARAGSNPSIAMLAHLANIATVQLAG